MRTLCGLLTCWPYSSVEQRALKESPIHVYPDARAYIKVYADWIFAGWIVPVEETF